MLASIESLDLTVFHVLNSLARQAGWSDLLIVSVASYLFYAVMAWFAVVAIRAYLKRTDALARDLFYGYCLALFAALFSRAIVTELIRMFYHRPRPFVSLHLIPLLRETSYSFPSGHSIFLFSLAMGVFFVYKKQGVILFMVSVLICAGRVMAGVHYPSDIVGGAVIGMAVSLLSFSVARRCKLIS